MNLPLPVALAHARLTMETVKPSEVDSPASATAAYEAQNQLSDLIDSPSLGWKVGATSAVSQEKLGVKAPICGPVFERTAIPNFRPDDRAEFPRCALFFTDYR